MAKTDNLTDFLTDVADAIRLVKGITTPINPQDFSDLIRSLLITVGGGISEDNVIILLQSVVGNGTYTLKYEDDTNTPLANFDIICELTVSDSDVSYSDFISVNIPPYLASSIGIYDSSESRVGFIPITNFKPEFGTRLYRFGLLSDVHDYEDSDAEPSNDFRTALSLFNEKEDVVMTCICGDITQNGTESEYQMYQEDITAASPDTPVYTTTGNHDCVQGASAIDETLWQSYTGQPLVFEISKTLDSGSTDHFLFLGMSAWNYTSAYTTTNLDWLEQKLESYKDSRCFVFTHLFFPDRAGNFKSIYPSGNWLSGSQLTRLQGMCDSYKNSIWFSGHSHWKWYLQKYEDNANIYRAYDSDGNPTCGWCVHVPSCASPIDSDGVSTRVSMPLESEGAVVDVYENYVDIRGINLKEELYLPIATYRLDTTLTSSGSEGTTTPEVEETVNPFASTGFSQNSYIYTNNTDEYPLVEYDADTDTFKITFSAASQKLIYESDLLTESITSDDFKVTCDNVRYLQNGTEITLSDSDKQGLGFYLTSGYYSVNTEYGELHYPSTFESTSTYYCLQFNSSGSKYTGIYPVTIEMTGLKLCVKSESTDSGSETEDLTGYLTASNFTYNTEKSEGATVTDSDEAGYVDVTFTGTSQGFWVTSDSFVATASGCEMIIEDISITANGSSVDTMAKCGFYDTSSSSYLLSSSSLVPQTSGVQFQTSSSCAGPFPIVIHMKAKLNFS